MNRLLLVALVTASIVWPAGAQDSIEPQELTNLRDAWKRARQQAVLPVDRKYLDALKALKLRLTKAGNLEQALAIEAEIQSVSTSSGDADADSPKLVTAADLLKSRWALHIDSSNWNDEWVFQADGNVFSKKGITGGTWVIVSRQLRVDFKSRKQWNLFSLEPSKGGNLPKLLEIDCSTGRKPGGTLTQL